MPPDKGFFDNQWSGPFLQAVVLALLGWLFNSVLELREYKVQNRERIQAMEREIGERPPEWLRKQISDHAKRIDRLERAR